jgi:hypothetical protein
MKPQIVEVVLVVDASGSMAPCFQQLRLHLRELVAPLQASSLRVRFGILAYKAGSRDSGAVFEFVTLASSHTDVLNALYGSAPNPAQFFTDDPPQVLRVLESLIPEGDEDTLLAVDVAADFPFGPLSKTQRVLAVFTDEPLEDGILGSAPIAKLDALIKKLMQRRIQLFMAAPMSPALELLASVDRCEIETVDAGNGLRTLNFGKLLTQMAKSISMSTSQTTHEPEYQRAIFGQNTWGRATATNMSEGQRLS